MFLPPTLAGDEAVGGFWRIVQEAIYLLIRCGRDSQGSRGGTNLLTEDQRLLLGFQHQLLLLYLKLLLAEPVQKLVRLGHDLRDQSIIVKVLDIYNLPIHFKILICCLVDIRY